MIGSGSPTPRGDAVPSGSRAGKPSRMPLRRRKQCGVPPTVWGPFSAFFAAFVGATYQVPSRCTCPFSNPSRSPAAFVVCAYFFLPHLDDLIWSPAFVVTTLCFAFFAFWFGFWFKNWRSPLEIGYDPKRDDVNQTVPIPPGMHIFRIHVPDKTKAESKVSWPASAFTTRRLG